MALKNRDAFKALEEIVGPEYISEEPAVLDSYAFNWGAELFTNTPFLPRAGAIVLPQKTEEIQAIVKLCNKLNVKYKAITNGWGFYCALGLDENAIHVDMRRMNRILEINEKSMYAVVEPYVTCSQLQGELMRRGFNMNMAGAGAGTSAMPVTAHMGTGPTGLTTSWNDRNCLAVEWVQPNGDILKLGSLGTGAGWFCGDGPGSSIRGVIRGPQTPMGGLGIFTKAATKIYPWYGPPKPEIEGNSPYYKLKEMIPNYDVHHPIFPNWDKLVEAAIRIGQAEIAFAIFRLPPPMLNEALTGNGDEAQEFLVKMREEVGDRPGFICILHGATMAEFNYRKKVFARILQETGGELFSPFEDAENKKEYLWTFIKLSTPIRESFRAVGRFLGALGDSANYGTSTKMMLECMELKKEYQARGNVRSDDGLDCVLGYVHENGHSGHAEQLIMCHPSGAGWKDLMEFTDRCEDLAISKHYTAPTTVWSDRNHDKWGPHCCNYQLWLRKIKKTFDPNGVAEASMYINAKE